MRSVCFSDLQRATAVGDNGEIFMTTNAGDNWTQQISGTFYDLSSVFFSDANNGTAVGRTGTIIRTTNGGTNWIPQVSGSSDFLFGVSFSDLNTGTAVGLSGTILRTSNGGVNWNSQFSGTERWFYDVCFTDNNNGTAVGNLGTIMKTTNGGSVYVTQLSDLIPEIFSLFQNYPNPFNPTTKIKFKLSRLETEAYYVRLIIFDALGREVITLINDRLEAGDYEIEFNGGDFPSGVYFYMLEAGNYSEVKRMILLK